MPQPRISRHLKILRDAGLLTDTRDAQWVIYAVSEPPPDSPEADLLAALRDWLEEAAETLSDRERLAKVSRAACAPLLSESRS
jgi:ArsR family transcriptional regulator